MAGIVHQIQDGLGIITLDDPEGGNRLDPESLAALQGSVTHLCGQSDVRALLLRSSGPAFCLGMNLSRLAAAETAAGDPRIGSAVETYVRILNTIRRCPRPVIALVNGAVKAGGVGLVSACDVVVASESSTFELGEAFFGIIPANVLPFLLTYRIPIQKARYLILTGRTLSGRDALALGLVDEVYPAEGLERGVRDLLKRMWRVSPDAAAEAKAFTQALLDAPSEAAQGLARDKLVELLGKPEVRGALRAFEQGDTPPWFRRFRPAGPLVLPLGGDDHG